MFRRYPTTAEDWAVRAQGADMSPAEQRALDAWLKADPKNAEAFAKCNQLGHLATRMRMHADLVEGLPAYAALQRKPAGNAGSSTSATRTHAPRAHAPQPIWRAIGRPVLAGGLAVALLGALVLVPALRGTDATNKPAAVADANTYTTQRGEQRMVLLADGSRVYINTSSQLRVKFAPNLRRVELAAGEAFFEVTKDPARPFVVAVGGSEVTVVGTKFAVRQDGSQTSVVVTEGKVNVVPQVGRHTEAVPDKVALLPGDALRFDARQQRVQVAQVDSEAATTWRNGSISFDNATLEEVIAEVNRYTQKPFVLEDEALKAVRLSGRFRVGDTESVVFALKDGFGVEAVTGEERVGLRRAK